MDSVRIDQYVEMLRNGEQTAVESIVRETQNRLRSFILFGCSGVGEVVDDIAQEVYIHALQNLEQYKTGTNFFAWLKIIARFKMKNYLRSEAARAAREERYTDALLMEAVIDRDISDEQCRRIEAMQTCVEKLPDESRELIKRRYSDRPDADPIGEGMEKSSSSVRTTLMRVRRQLRKCVQSKMSLAEAGI